jgi:DNA-binding transcriptional ArsR family regulator
MNHMSDRCVDFCKALSDSTRQSILELLQEREMYVGEITAAFALSQPSISHHLGILRDAGVVTSRREGQSVFYSLNQENVRECCGMLMTKFVSSSGCEMESESTGPVED